MKCGDTRKTMGMSSYQWCKGQKAVSEVRTGKGRGNKIDHLLPKFWNYKSGIYEWIQYPQQYLTNEEMIKYTLCVCVYNDIVYILHIQMIKYIVLSFCIFIWINNFYVNKSYKWNKKIYCLVFYDASKSFVYFVYWAKEVLCITSINYHIKPPE